MRTWFLHPLLKVFLTLLIISGVSIVVQIPFVLLGIYAPDFAGSRAGMLLTQGTVSALSFIGGAILCAWLFSLNPGELLPLRKVKKRVIGVALAGFICALPTVGLVQIWNKSLQLPEGYAEIQQLIEKMEKAVEEATEVLVSGTTVGDLLINLIVIALIPAIGEEMVFRGTIQQPLQQRYGIHAAVWITAILFSAAHYEFMGFYPRMLLGLLLGYTAAWSGSLHTSMLLHFFNNGMVVVTYWICHRQGIDTGTVDSNQDALLMQGILPALALFCGTMMAAHYLRVHYETHQPSTGSDADATSA